MLQCKALYWKSSKHTLRSLQVTPLSSATINLHTQQTPPVIPSQSLPPRPTTQNLSCLMTIKEAVIRSCAGASSLTSRHNLEGRFLCLRCYIRRHYEGACSAGSSLIRVPYASRPLCARARAGCAALAQRAGLHVPPGPRALPCVPSDSGHASNRPCPETPLHSRHLAHSDLPSRPASRRMTSRAQAPVLPLKRSAEVRHGGISGSVPHKSLQTEHCSRRIAHAMFRTRSIPCFPNLDRRFPRRTPDTSNPSRVHASTRSRHQSVSRRRICDYIKSTLLPVPFYLKW